MSTNETITGSISEMKPSVSDNPKAPSGYITVDGMRLTIWEKETWDALEVGKSYTFVCSIKQNEYNGKHYTNRDVQSCMPVEPLEKSDLKIGAYDVIIDDNAMEIHMPKIAIDFLKEKLE